MPELPEVETIKNGLQKTLVNKKIIGIKVLDKKIIKNNFADFSRALVNKKINKIERVGKLLILHLDSGNFLLVHLKMTGQLIYVHHHRLLAGGHNLPRLSANDLPGKFTRVVVSFNDQSKLYFNDMRKFGYFKIVNQNQKDKIVAAYGLNPLSKNFTSAALSNILKNRKAPIKTILLNQKLIAGIGNIYADEICFNAAILPFRPANSLNQKEIKKLIQSIKNILSKAVKYGGTTFKDYVNHNGEKGGFVKYLKVYQREKLKCLRCKIGVIAKKKISGRESRFCLTCQH